MDVAIISDGCSSSSHTDFGARFWVQGAKNQLKHMGHKFNIHAVGSEVTNIAYNMELPLECLDASLIVAFLMEIEDRKYIKVIVTGDGVIAARKRNSTDFDYYKIDYSNNAPAYMNYTLNPFRLEEFFNPGVDFPLPTGVRSTQSNVGDLEDENLDPKDRDSFCQTHLFPADEYDLILLCTDGVDSFQCLEPRGEILPVHFTEVLHHLMQVKQPRGEFITRRMQKFLGSFCKKNNWTHTDDLAVAGIYIEGEES